MNMTTADRNAFKLRALGHEFGKTNRILTGDKNITVTVMNEADPAHENFPGWSAYPGIWINGKFFPNMKDHRTLVELLGLNYHELAHLMFTPRHFKAKLRGDAAKDAWNVLEDQRIESLFHAKYGPAGKYFTGMVVKMFVMNQNSWGSAFLYTYGRSFLPLEIREEFEDRFKGSTRDKNRAKAIINHFKSFTSSDFEDPYRVAEFQRICDEFARIMGRVDADSSDCGGGEQQRGQTRKKEEKKAQKDEKENREHEDETGEDQSGFWDDEEEDDEDESASGEDEEYEDGEMGDGDSDDDSDEAGDYEDEDGEGSGEGDSDSESESDDSGSGDGDEGDEEPESGDGDASGHGESDSDTEDDEEVEADDDGETSVGGSGKGESAFEDEELREYLADIIEAVNEDDDVLEEVGRMQDAMNDRNKIDVIDFDMEGSKELFEVDQGMQQSVRQVTNELRRVYAEVEPGWRYGSDSGRLNVGRAMADPENYDEMFDEWEEGREQESGIECFISVDTSYSMVADDLNEPAFKALWIIKRALDDVGAKTTVVSFDVTTQGLVSRDEKMPAGKYPMWSHWGGDTRPAQSMHIGRRLLDASNMPNKLFILLTDGEWSNTDAETGGFADFHQLIRSIQATKMYVGLGAGSLSNRAVQQEFDEMVVMNDYNDLVKVVKATVSQIVQSKRRR